MYCCTYVLAWFLVTSQDCALARGTQGCHYISIDASGRNFEEM